jgi:hypothetical protein
MSNAAAIVIDLDGNGIVTQSAADAKVRYDWDGDGLADQTSWIGATEGFLFLDRDGNGTVTGPSELAFWLTPGGAAVAADQALKALDTNGDGLLSTLDADFANLRVWQDKNGNGVADSGEILTLSAAGVRSLNAGLTAGDGATLQKGTYTRTNGTTQNLAELSLGYVSVPNDGLPALTFLAQTYDYKSKRFGFVAKDGQIVVTGKHIDAVDSRAGGLNGATTMTFADGSVGMLSALVLDLDGNGVSLARRGKSNAGFDMNGDGVADDTGWAAKGDGFLVIDRDNDGLITNAYELSFFAESATAKNSLAGLAALDSNGDHVLDKKDARFGELKVWIDANGNGVSDEGELKSLAELGIASFDLNPHNASGKAKVGDNLLLATATFTRTDGSVGTLGDAALAFKAGAGPRTAASRAPPLPLEPATPGEPDAGDPAGPGRPFGPLPTPDDLRQGPTGMFASAATQLASAIAAFGTPDASAEIDMAKALPDQHPIVLAPPPAF